jgi:hypothetical protein
VERLNRALLDEWAYVRPYISNAERTTTPADFLHTYDHHRGHTALGGHPSISRANDAEGQYTQHTSDKRTAFLTITTPFDTRRATSFQPPTPFQENDTNVFGNSIQVLSAHS